MRKLVFIINQVEEDQFIARAADESIFTQAHDFETLKHNIIEAVETHFEPDQLPIKILFRFERAKTLSIIGYLAAVYAWMLEACALLLHLFGKVKLDSIGHFALLAATISLSTFAWYRRDDFRALRTSRGSIALTGFQTIIVIMFVVAISLLAMGILVLIFGR